jgi:hypothetical protein
MVMNRIWKVYSGTRVASAYIRNEFQESLGSNWQLAHNAGNLAAICQTGCLEYSETSMSRNFVGFHGLLQG